MDRAEIGTMAETETVRLRKRLNERGPVHGAAGGIARQGFVRKHRPQIRCARGVFRCERQTGLFARPVIVVRSRRFEIERKNEKPPQKLPDRLIIGRCIGCGEVMTESLDEIPHPVRGKSRAREMRGEDSGVGQPPRPLQHLLAIALDARRASRDGDGHFVAMRREARLLRGGPEPPNHVGEIRIAPREVDRALGLKIEEGVRSVGVERIDRHVIERPTVRRLLEPDGANHGTGQTARLAARQQSEHIKRAETLPSKRAPAGPAAAGETAVGGSALPRLMRLYVPSLFSEQWYVGSGPCFPGDKSLFAL